MNFRWKLDFNDGGDCLWEFQDPDWVVVHGCDVGDPECACEKPPIAVPSVSFPRLIEIVRMPCVAGSAIDAYGFLVAVGRGNLHCIRAKTSKNWVHYFYKLDQTAPPAPSAFEGFEGYMECTDASGSILALGILANASQLGQMKQLMQLLNFQQSLISDFLKSQSKGFDAF